MANEAFHLDWHGPFGIVDGGADPNLFVAKSEESRLPGVYVWTIPIGDEYWPHYIGKAEDRNGLLARLRAEARPKEPKRGFAYDMDLMLQGERVCLYEPLNSKGKPNEELWQKSPD
jgi:hypothetical protein